MTRGIGIVRHVDDLGRIVIPAELRHVLDIKIKDEVEITAEDGKVIVQKSRGVCLFCGGPTDGNEVLDKPICEQCQSELSEMTE